MSKPVLSIGIIFKNEIRCLERCMKSLQPLRKAVHCELVMADTGADDGSREIAEKYADILFDFPWINDFSAARNAVMDRSTGDWFLTLDADEWLDEDVSDLVNFLTTDRCKGWDVCALTERNYHSYDFTKSYGVFMAWRLLRMSTGIRYTGAIHEAWTLTNMRALALQDTLIHHDGYVTEDPEKVRKKRERNMTLLREKLEQNPDSIVTLLQLIESGEGEPDYYEFLHRDVELVEEKREKWDMMGPSIYRYAIAYGRAHKFPELEKWLQEAEDWFPNSFFILIDASLNAATYFLEKEQFESCVRWCERGLKAHEDYEAGRGDIACQIYGSLLCTEPWHREALKVILARGYFGVGKQEQAVQILEGLQLDVLDTVWTKNLQETIHMIHFRSYIEISALVKKVWEGINAPHPNKKWEEDRKKKFFEIGALTFSASYQASEDRDGTFCRRGYTMYLPLAGECILGTAAAILASEDPGEIGGLLHMVENLDELPPSVLAHAIKAGVPFPLPDKLLTVEKMDNLVVRLAENKEELLELTRKVGEISTLQSLTWVRGLFLTAVKVCSWEDEAEGMDLARRFAAVEQKFLSLCYTPELLRPENLLVLPAMHRFGWHCAQAFHALDSGDLTGYVHCLREGLSSCEGMKAMVEFLTKHTPEIHQSSQELLELAEKVRTLLAAYDPADPAVAALKQSLAYQKVAHLIEGIEVSAIGGLAQ